MNADDWCDIQDLHKEKGELMARVKLLATVLGECETALREIRDAGEKRSWGESDDEFFYGLSCERGRIAREALSAGRRILEGKC